MLDQETTRAVSLVGLGIQTALTLLLALLFAVLSRTGSERPYFSIWTRAWAGFFVGLSALCLFFTSASTSLAQQTFALVYQAGKAAYFLGLAWGAWVFVMGPARKPPRWSTTGPFAVMVAASLPFLANIERLVAVQAFLAVPVLVWAARQMTFTRAPRRTAAVTACAATLGAMATLWAFYLLEYASRTAGFPAPKLIQHLVAGYNSYFDLLLETLLAFGMVLVRNEDAQRELVAAHEALGEAHARLRESSLHDPLTAALNRRAFDEHTETLPSGGGTVVALDLDGMKSVNDRWGHEVGDELLRHFAASMRAQLRDSDRLYRTGGDEFVIIAPGADAERLSSRIERALAGISPLPATDTHPAVQVSSSWGAAAFTAPAEISAALRAADARMYERKHGGRQRGHPAAVSIPKGVPEG
jgi:diguanylate cyclase (GGDEF)-like protein